MMTLRPVSAKAEARLTDVVVLPSAGAGRGDEEDANVVVSGRRLTPGRHEGQGRAQGPVGLGGRVVLLGPHDQPLPTLLAVERGDLRDHGVCEGVLGATSVAQSRVKALDHQRHPGAEQGADEGCQRHSGGS